MPREVARPPHGIAAVRLHSACYCLVVLRSIRSGDEGAFVPSLAVFGGLVLISIGVLIYFIHHITESVQASVILDARRLELLHEQVRLTAAVAAATLDYEYDRATVRRSLAGACRVTSPLASRLPDEWLPTKRTDL